MAKINNMEKQDRNTTLQKVYVIALAEQNGEFNWIYTHPKPFYLSIQEALEIRNSLIEQEESITEKNCIVKKLYRVIPEK